MAQRFQRERSAGGRHHIGHQPLVAGRRALNRHDNLLDIGAMLQCGLDFAQFHAETADLHLRVLPPQKLDIPIMPPAGAITSPVEPRARRRIEGVRNKAGSRQFRALEIFPRQTIAA